MGACITHIKKEMHAPAPRSGNWEGLAPRRPEPVAPRSRQQNMQKVQPGNGNGNGNGARLRRIETPSGIPGLTYDYAGRPVWREENAVKGHAEHREDRGW